MLVYQAHTSDVRTVIINGEVVVNDRQPTMLGEQQHLLRAALAASEQPVERAGRHGELRGRQSRSRN